MTKKILAYKDRLHKTPKFQCSWLQCTRQPEWSLIDNENPRASRAFCTPHALEFIKNNDFPLRDIPMALAENIGDAPRVPKRPYTAKRSRFHLETWLAEGRNGMEDLDDEIIETKAQYEALIAKQAVLKSILGAVPEELKRQLDEALLAAVKDDMTPVPGGDDDA